MAYAVALCLLPLLAGAAPSCPSGKNCSACLAAGCFYQPTPEGNCAATCEVADMSCYGNDSQWSAPCPSEKSCKHQDCGSCLGAGCSWQAGACTAECSSQGGECHAQSCPVQGCAGNKNCSSCTFAGCFWQAQHGCASKCLVADDAACYGRTEQWSAQCPGKATTTASSPSPPPNAGEGCRDEKSCGACLQKGCFWQGVTGGVCAPECEIMDVSCWGKAKEWEAACPTTSGVSRARGLPALWLLLCALAAAAGGQRSQD